jgi:hypothetical protein
LILGRLRMGSRKSFGRVPLLVEGRAMRYRFNAFVKGNKAG